MPQKKKTSAFPRKAQKGDCMNSFLLCVCSLIMLAILFSCFESIPDYRTILVILVIPHLNLTAHAYGAHKDQNYVLWS